jgi:hypothetical protein
MKEKLSEMEQKLLSFILNNSDFFNLAKKYTFIYRDFTPFMDYCKIKWNREAKEFEFVEYYCHNVNKKMPSVSVNTFFLDLNITGFNWGTLLSEVERQFEKYLENLVIKGGIEKDGDKYKKLKNEYSSQHKDDIINRFFILNEETIKDYFMKTIKSLRR